MVSQFLLWALDFMGFVVASFGFNFIKCLFQLRSSSSSCRRNLLVSSSDLGAERLILVGLKMVFSPGLCGSSSSSSSCVLLATLLLLWFSFSFSSCSNLNWTFHLAASFS